MLIRRTDDGFHHPVASDITPAQVYWQRRQWLQAAATGALGVAWAGWAQRQALAAPTPSALPVGPHGRTRLVSTASAVPGARSTDKLTPYQDVTSYNNFYEFGFDKDQPAQVADRMAVRPWVVQVEGLVHKPRTFGIEELLKLAPLEERIYRLRCVEGWSMVIPWVGYSLAALIRQVQPTGSAKYVAFQSQADAASMPGLRSDVLDWPYTEGLRLDEAMHPLTLLALGLYGEVLPQQNGAPVRLVVPWKYGFKSGKSIVKIRFTDKQPTTAWNASAPQEYGFYANVNPTVDHPRWSQSTEKRIGEGGLFAKRRKTVMFNGYEAQVGQLYAGMDLARQF